jgi:hypothetical protein
MAFGAPGIAPRWTSSAKEGLGTAYSGSCRLLNAILCRLSKRLKGSLMLAA